MIIKTKKTALAVILMSGAFSNAMAGLYVSPVMRDAVVFNQASANEKETTVNTAIKSVNKTSDNQSGKEISGSYGNKGDFILQENPVVSVDGTKSVSKHPAYRFGSNVPLFVAIENVIPEGSYDVNIDDIIADRTVSWEGGNSWKGVLRAIAEQNDLAVTVNEREKVIGIATQADISEALAQSDRQVWRIIEGRSLKDNLNMWAKQSGWTLYWDVQIDYPIEHSAVLFGDVKSSLDVLLSAFSDKPVPLGANFHKGNKVIQIVEGGYKRGE